MEEDIKILQKLASRTRLIAEDLETAVCSIDEQLAIRNLIARYKELEKIVKTYNAIPNDYMPNNVKIVIADREYFNNGILKENIIPKSKVKEIFKKKNSRII